MVEWPCDDKKNNKMPATETCDRFGHWLTMCTLNMHLLTYLLKIPQSSSKEPQPWKRGQVGCKV